MTLRQLDVSLARHTAFTYSRSSSRQLTLGSIKSCNSRSSPPAPLPLIFWCAIIPCRIAWSMSRASSFFCSGVSSLAPSQSCSSMPPSPPPPSSSSCSCLRMSNTCLVFMPRNLSSIKPIFLPTCGPSLYIGMAMTFSVGSRSLSIRLIT